MKVILLDGDAEEDEKGVEERGDAPVVDEPEEAAIVEKKPTTDSAVERAVIAEEGVDGGTEVVAATGDTEETSAGDVEEVFAGLDSKEVVEAGEEEAAEADSELAAEEGEPAAEEDEVAAEVDEEVAEEGKEMAAEEDKGVAAEEDKEAAVEEDKEAAVCESMDEDAPTIDLCSEADERDVDDMDEEAVKVELKGDDPENPPEEYEAGKENESPILNGGDVVGLPAMGLKEDLDMEQVLAIEPKKRRRLASSGYSSLAELKKALGVTDGSDAAPDGSKRIKFEDGAESDKGVLTECKPEEGVSQTPPPVGIPVGPNLVVLSRAQLEAYVAQRVRECLALQGQALLQPMEKKCETLHRALERWRRRSFQLQKQLNEFVCEQERCAGARRNRVMQRSVGVCVRMPPLKQQPTLTPIVATSRPTISTANSTVAAGVNRPSQPTPGMVQQVRMTGASASNLAAQLGFKPNQAMKLVTVSTPSGGTTTVVTRMPPQLQVASPSTPTSMPVPVQLIANTGTPSQQVKSVSLPSGTATSGTVVRTVAVVSSASSTPSTVSQTVKFIDLTQEEEGHAKVISMPAMSMAGNTVQKISMPSSAIPVLSAAPTSLVQVTPSASQPVLRAATAVSSGVVTQAGGSFRLTPSMMAQPRVTYLVPSLPPGMVVTPKESGPRIISGTPGSGTAMPMQTILLRMASPQGGFTTVPGNAITMGSLTPMPGGPGGPGTTMMVQAPAGSQVRMIRAPPPLSLPRGGTTLTLPPGTTLVRGPPNQGGGVTLVGGTPVGGVSGGPASSSTTTVRVPVPVPVSKPAGVAETTRGSPVVPVGAAIAVPAGTSVLGKVDTPASATAPPPVAKHPAPLPPTARYLDDPKKKRLPPKPALKITKAASGLVLSWNMTFNSLYAEIQTYQLYAYQETGGPPATSHWKKVGDVRALPLPMACTLTQFVEGHKYHFAVRAVDIHNRLGPFSEPSSILLK
ncbi:activating transcription factor 7-interacting protein 1 isoform X2 [Ixodes scapularis]|uniref:activating transcription factor 7-interacting protein 1 isoform X2 n=1 Tax=Ixodes scapularis TaxID=6945 RepID=UPI001A9CDA35|nr:activating transcription factor 7-interacting protein 1 isoform X2 [Ixodes scapularis]